MHYTKLPKYRTVRVGAQLLSPFSFTLFLLEKIISALQTTDSFDFLTCWQIRKQSNLIRPPLSLAPELRRAGLGCGLGRKGSRNSWSGLWLQWWWKPVWRLVHGIRVSETAQWVSIGNTASEPVVTLNSLTLLPSATALQSEVSSKLLYSS